MLARERKLRQLRLRRIRSDRRIRRVSGGARRTVVDAVIVIAADVRGVCGAARAREQVSGKDGNNSEPPRPLPPAQQRFANLDCDGTLANVRERSYSAFVVVPPAGR
jgi:hypothetical protein